MGLLDSSEVQFILSSSRVRVVLRDISLNRVLHQLTNTEILLCYKTDSCTCVTILLNCCRSVVANSILVLDVFAIPRVFEDEAQWPVSMLYPPEAGIISNLA